MVRILECALYSFSVSVCVCVCVCVCMCLCICVCGHVSYLHEYSYSHLVTHLSMSLFLDCLSLDTCEVFHSTDDGHSCSPQTIYLQIVL
jgi:hypothetical protein